eukprot:CAMPEP_0206194798 /NCGR_PEP_ID=MMETSP0166-20121206/7433_1 /ASSEMBLY_ACC=CAM_ASM_000260 /TAXON_ID=95228 /ORGANISM="Vannella robusta, Strain DIVA3 518/3/11/1/6" /LENGTH=417 /DNA_ID=CAMNT_0053611883 /DNA_START=88 /DNA_END=1341 /DNA_ORIENTATION=+
MEHTFIENDHPLFGKFSERRGGAAVENFEMGGNIYPVGIYWVSVNIGTPAQALLAAVDSGSSDLLVPSSSCTGCHEQNTGSFDTSKSSTLQSIGCDNSTIKCHFPCQGQCSFSNSYQTCNLTAPQQVCTVKGDLYSDVYGQGDLTASVVFGLIESQTTNFQQFFVIDGVIGMAFASGSSWGGTPPFERLVEEGEVEDIFAMCMKPNAGGVLTLGGTDPSLYTGSFQYTPLKKFFGQYILYVLDVTDIQLNNTSIGLPTSDYTRYGTMGGCVLDSGTNTILLPAEIYAAWQTTFNSFYKPLCGSSADVPAGICDGSLLSGTCYQYTQAERESFPQIELKLNDVTLVMNGPDYIVANSTDTTGAYYCMGVLNTGHGGNFIVGDVLMQNYYVVFDKQNKRIGWADPQMDNCIGSDSPIYY